MRNVDLKFEPWTKEEDILLKKFVTYAYIFLVSLSIQSSGKKKWAFISKELYKNSPTEIYRNGKKCKERWINYIDPEMKRFCQKLIPEVNGPIKKT